MPLNSPLRAAVRLALYLGWTLLLLPVQAVAVALDLPLARTLPAFYHRICARLLGLRIETRGRRAVERPLLLVSNHNSYLDITVLGALIAGSFVAKREVASWPMFGQLAKLQRTVFVERRARHAATQRDAIAARLEKGEQLILFPEGTSSDGNRVLPFKSALFSVAERRFHDRPLAVQPVSLAYTRLDGIPLGRGLRPHYAWYGDMDLAGHMWTLAGLGRVTAVVTFHAPVSIDQFGSRKALSDHCQAVVAAGVSAALAGRFPPDVEAEAEAGGSDVDEDEAAAAAAELAEVEAGMLPVDSGARRPEPVPVGGAPADPGSGQAGSGQAGSGQAGSGQAGSGQAGPGSPASGPTPHRAA